MTTELSRPRAVLCLSGGMDSSVCAALAARDYEGAAVAVEARDPSLTLPARLESLAEVTRFVGRPLRSPSTLACARRSAAWAMRRARLE